MSNRSVLVLNEDTPRIEVAQVGDTYNLPRDTNIAGVLSLNSTAITSTANELNLLDGSSASTVTAGKAVIYGGSGEVNATTLQIAGDSIDVTADQINKGVYAQQVVTVAKAGKDYTLIQSAIDSISDATSAKTYTVLVYPGEYDEAITLKDYVNIVAVDPKATKILRQVTDNNVECHCYLNITIESASVYGLYTRHANTVITVDGDVSSSNASGVLNYGTTTVNGNISSSVDMGMSSCGSGLLIVNGDVSSVSNNGAVYLTDGDIILNGNIINTRNASHGHGVTINGNGAFTHRNGSIYVTHADAKAIYAGSAQNAYLMGVWGNRELDSNITDVLSGFTYNINVPSPNP